MKHKYIDVEFLQEKISQQMKSVPRKVGGGVGTITSNGYGIMQAFQIVRSLIDSLQRKQPIEGKQVVIITETDGDANIHWDCRSLDDVKALLASAQSFIADKQVEELREQGSGPDYNTTEGRFRNAHKFQQEHPNNMIQWTGNNLKEVIDFTGKSPRFEEWFKIGRELGFCEGVESVKPVEWSAYDKATIEYIIEDVKELRDEETDEEVIETYDRELNLLRCINDSVKLCNYTNPTEWSEEDDALLKEIVSFFKDRTVKLQHDLDLYAGFLENKFKSLRPQPHWKPSYEQINALKVVVHGYPADDPDAIDSLLTDLQKLL